MKTNVFFRIIREMNTFRFRIEYNRTWDDITCHPTRRSNKINFTERHDSVRKRQWVFEKRDAPATRYYSVSQ